MGRLGFLLRKKNVTRDIKRRLLTRRILDFPNRKGRMMIEAKIPVFERVKIKQKKKRIAKGELKNRAIRIQR